MDLNKAIKTRHSVRKFKDKKPDWRNLIECIDFARYAPMAGNIFTLRFIITQDKNKIEQISKSAQQEFLKKAPAIILICSDPKRTITSYGERGEIYSRQQAGAAIQNILLRINEIGLGATWVGHFAEDQVKRLFKIPDEINLEALIPIGYELKPTKPKEKANLDAVLYFEEYKNKRMKEPEVIGTR